jgi:hypothetical protein
MVDPTTIGTLVISGIIGLVGTLINGGLKARLRDEVTHVRKCVTNNLNKLTDSTTNNLNKLTDSTTNNLNKLTDSTTNNLDKLTDGGLNSLAMLTHRLDMSLKCVTNNLDQLTNGGLMSLAMLTHRLDISLALMTNAIVGLAAATALAPLLYLTQFSPLLRSIVWMMYGSLGFSMVLTYLQQSQFFIGKNIFAHHPYYYNKTRLSISLFQIKDQRTEIKDQMLEEKCRRF